MHVWWTNANIEHRFIISEATTINDTYFAALASDYDLGRTRGIDATLEKFKLDAIIIPTDGQSSSYAMVAANSLYI